MRLDKKIPLKFFAVDLCIKSQVSEERCVCVCIWAFVCVPSCFVRGKGNRERKRKMSEGKRGVISLSTLQKGCLGSLVIKRQEAHFFLLMNLYCNYWVLVNLIKSQGLDYKYIQFTEAIWILCEKPSTQVWNQSVNRYNSFDAGCPLKLAVSLQW